VTGKISHPVGDTIFTVGHSTRSLAKFVSLLHESAVTLVVDVRSTPRSRTTPQFNGDTLPDSLTAAAIGYRHLAALGGRRQHRKGAPASPNTYWRVAAFRNYADYAETDEFRAGLAQLRVLATGDRCAVMCAEAVWWRCHRRIITDYLLVGGAPVEHIMGRPGRRGTLHPARRSRSTVLGIRGRGRDGRTGTDLGPPAPILPSELMPPVSFQDGRRRMLVDRFDTTIFKRVSELISAVLSGRDALVVMLTGSGKSVIYQLPALMLSGPTVVVSPLIAPARTSRIS
jgi:hypothetical protein